MAKMFRCSFTFPPELATQISRVARRMGVSQSAMLTEVLSEPVAQLDALLAQMPSDTDVEAVRRFRGQSRELIRRELREALDAIEGPAS